MSHHSFPSLLATLARVGASDDATGWMATGGTVPFDPFFAGLAVSESSSTSVKCQNIRTYVLLTKDQSGQPADLSSFVGQTGIVAD